MLVVAGGAQYLAVFHPGGHGGVGGVGKVGLHEDVPNIARHEGGAGGTVGEGERDAFVEGKIGPGKDAASKTRPRRTVAHGYGPVELCRAHRAAEGNGDGIALGISAGKHTA